MRDPIGYYLNCDDAVCDRHAPDDRAGVDGWPAPIWEDSESDTPTHCVVCEELIPHELTIDGRNYVVDAVLNWHYLHAGRECIVAAWWRWYGDGCEVADRNRIAWDAWAAAAPRTDEYTPKETNHA